MFSLLIACAMTAPAPRLRVRPFIKYMSEKHGITEAEAEKNIKIFTSSVFEYLIEGKKADLYEFGTFFSALRVYEPQHKHDNTSQDRKDHGCSG